MFFYHGVKINETKERFAVNKANSLMIQKRFVTELGEREIKIMIGNHD